MKLKRFTGLNNVDSPLDVGLTGLTRARNVDIDRKGQIESRQGATKIADMAIIAAWHDKSHLLMLTADNGLWQMQNGVPVQIATIPGSTLAAIELNNLIYLSTDMATRVIDGSAVREAGVPYASATATVLPGGNLKAGRYMVNAIAVAPDGRESGAMDSFIIDVPEDSKLQIDAVAPGAEYGVKVYISGADGEQLYHVGNTPTVVIADPIETLNASEVLDRLYKSPMPPVSIMDEFQSCIIAATGNVVIASDPLDYELFDLLDSIFMFNSEVLMLRAVGTGFFVGTADAVHFITGEIPGSWVIRESYRYGVVAGSDQIVDMSLVGQGSSGKGVMFLSERGICLASADGGVTNLTERKLLIPKLNRVSSLIDGSRYVLALQ